MPAPDPAMPDRVTTMAAKIKAGMRLADAREEMGLTKGQAAHTMRMARRRGLIGEEDNHWLRKVRASGAAATRDKIADMAALGMTLTEIADMMGVSLQCISRHWRRICQDLGWQAQ